MKRGMHAFRTVYINRNLYHSVSVIFPPQSNILPIALLSRIQKFPGKFVKNRYFPDSFPPVIFIVFQLLLHKTKALAFSIITRRLQQTNKKHDEEAAARWRGGGESGSDEEIQQPETVQEHRTSSRRSFLLLLVVSHATSCLRLV